MGFFEIVLLGMGMVFGVLAILAARFVLPPPLVPSRHRPFPSNAVFMAIGALVVVTFVAALGGRQLALITLRYLGEAGELGMVAHTPVSSLQLRLAGLSPLLTWLGAPVALALLWLLTIRTELGALGLAMGSFLGFTVGALIWLAVVPAALPSSLPGAPIAYFSIQAVGGFLDGLTGFGWVGMAFPAVAMVSASSVQARRMVVLMTAGMPTVALGFGALYSPPDPLSQLLLAIPLGVAWLGGLAAGSLALSVRSGSATGEE